MAALRITLSLVFLLHASTALAVAIPAAQPVGHRATMLFAPENTLAAIERALELGAKAIELDIRQSRDGHLVIMHDATVERTTDGTGAVRELTLAQIKQLDAGSKFSPEFKNERVPTLAQALKLMHGRAKPDIDLKAGDLAKLRAVLIEAGLTAPSSGTFLGTLEEMAEVQRWNVLDARPTSTFKSLSLDSLVDSLGARIINVPELQFSKGYIDELRSRGLKSFVNVILNRPFEEARLRRVVEARPDYIQTDRLDLLVPMLEALEAHPRK